jgi:hypothetical protein
MSGEKKAIAVLEKIKSKVYEILNSFDAVDAVHGVVDYIDGIIDRINKESGDSEDE